jgi:hypothetical protein
MLVILRSLLWGSDVILTEPGSVIATITGVEGVSSAGTVSAFADSAAALSGVSSATSAGNLIATGDATVALADLEVTSSTGILLAQGDIQQPVVSGGGLWGVKGIGPYTLPQDANVTLQGISLRAKAGKLRPHVDVDLSDDELLILLAAVA